MALTDQPYFPFYVDDYLTDEKLLMCDSSSEGIYIRLLCHMHKSDDYGMLTLSNFEKEKLKRKIDSISIEIDISSIDVEEQLFWIYVLKIKSLTGRCTDDIAYALLDLLGNDVIHLSNGVLWQKRMFKDGQKSITKAENGKKRKQFKGENDDENQVPKKQNKSKPEANQKQNESKPKAKPEQNQSKTEANPEQNVIDMFHEKCPDLPSVQILSDTRKTTIQKRLKDHGIAKITKVLSNVSNSKFLNGHNDRGWKANFNWIFENNNFIKILEGNYNNKDPLASQNFVSNRPPSQTFKKLNQNKTKAK